MKDIYYILIDKGLDIDHYGSDLYVEVTDISMKIIKDYQFKEVVTIFRANNGKSYYDIPFAYSPYWEKRKCK